MHLLQTWAKTSFWTCCSAALCEQYMEDQVLVCFVSWKLSQLVPDDFNITDQQMVPLKVKFSVTKQYMPNTPHKELKMLCVMRGCTRQEYSSSFDSKWIVWRGSLRKETLSASLRFKQPEWLRTDMHNQASKNINGRPAAGKKYTEDQRMNGN